MMERRELEIIVIGGSWGGIQASMEILKDIPENYKVPVVLILHRLKNFESDLETLYRKKVHLKVKELDEKELPVAGFLYIAPANYHVLFEKDKTCSLDSSEPEHYSRPSIDVTFRCVAEVYGSSALGILLTGANKDGSSGLSAIAKAGGITIVQNPLEAEVDTMPQAAIDLIPECKIFSLLQIREFLLSLDR